MKIAQRYIYPPRPQEGSVPQTELANFKSMGWQGQLKFNGSRLMLSKNGGEATFYNRHNDVHKRYNPPAWMQEEITEACMLLGLDQSEWNLLDGELIHHKHKLFSDTIALWDILVRDSEWLLDTTYEERYNSLLAQLPPDPEMFYLEIGDEKFLLGIKLTEHIFIPILTDNLQGLWDLTQEVNKAAGWDGEGEPALEGVVLKKPSGKLKPGLKEKNNADWCTRCRVQTGRHAY